MFTADQLRTHLRGEWEKNGCKIAPDERVGLEIAELIEHSRERALSAATPYVKLWVTVLDEFISWHLSLFSTIYPSPNDEPWTHFQRSVYMLVGKIIADSLSLRHLVVLGFDSSSKTLLRSLTEYMEVLVAVLHKPSFAEEFVKSDTPEGSKHFWSQHLRGGKIRRRVEDAWRTFISDGDGAAEWFANWGRESNDLLSGFAHPSFAGSMFAAVPLKTAYSDEAWLGIWGDPSDGSVETIFTYAKYMFPILLLSRDFPFNGFTEELGFELKFDEKNEFHRHLTAGRNVLGSLILSLCAENNRPHVFPEYDLSIWRK